MKKQDKDFNSLINSLSIINIMDSGQGALQAIAEYYGLKRYLEFFNRMYLKALDNETFLSETDIQEIIRMQDNMLGEIHQINSGEATRLTEALRNL